MKIYLAGPDVFRKDAIKHGAMLKDKCETHGCEGLFPFDNEVPDGLPGSVQAEAIYAANLKMIRDCDAVLANLDPFRGPSVDPGTAFEIGMAVALGKKVIGYYTGGRPIGEYKSRVSISSAVNSEYQNIEDFGQEDNLMISMGCLAIFYSFDEALDVLVKMS